MPLGRQITSEVQGSGFVYEFEDQIIIITNNHVVEGAINIAVIFADGNSSDAEIIVTDFSTDLAILSVAAPTSECYALEILSSQTVSVGDYVIAIGSPYG